MRFIMKTHNTTFDNQENILDEIMFNQMPGEIQLNEATAKRLADWLKHNEKRDLGEILQEDPDLALANDHNPFNVLAAGASYFQDNGMQGFCEKFRHVALYKNKALIVYETGSWQNVVIDMDGEYKDVGGAFWQPVQVIVAPTEQQIEQAVQGAQELIDQETTRRQQAM